MLKRDLYWILPLALILGALLAFIQNGDLLIGWLAFSFLFLLSFVLLTLSTRWANGGKTLAWMVALAFALRFIGGVTTYVLLPIAGYSDADDRAGFVYTDAHRRDAQAWDLADSDRSLFGAFNQSYAYDQYGGLLTMSAFIYRYLSPDTHRPLLLVLISAFMAALGLPFLWKAVCKMWSEKLALAACWIYVLYPESVLVGGSAMREPYLMAFSAFALWGFVNWHRADGRVAAEQHTETQPEEAIPQKRIIIDSNLLWIAAGLIGMLFVSPVVALATLVIFVGWMYFVRAGRPIPWWGVAAAALVFIFGLFLLSAALNRSGEFNSSSPLHVVSDWLKLAIQWDVYQLERGSGWVQKLFNEMPRWLRLPFVIVYGLFQPVLPAALVEPTTITWRVIGILRAVGWYALLPVLVFSFISAWNDKDSKLWLWLNLAVWGWILFASLRGGGDQWDNPRYRTILFLWEALLAGHALTWLRETRNAWFGRILVMEAVFVLFFSQWYANRYYHLGGQLPFALMVAVIFGLWGVIVFWGLWRDRNASR
jgi:hypothetical protein